ncbi:MAG TPA: hydrogenase nickel incorporation protein HypB [Anaerolineaceae bacterium]|jgi:hydrogenase nickel incorporation protein HypB|nr:hydrogenase nickel incorporation protein HypB [Anaerolineales bacterium]HOG57945.1 hydrogenase nickel incorporation protein HypB [Anaerolineaceae bacterium]HOR83790.1 hydrogenase nickel incorporation protein HypB [Anaerolineaceae bacterium]HOT53241.1 hydrogenase nickel incorporation protein HypB [Anaerolineaceae bacterium]HPL42686.1 hydrogenase nickel incorporation protein HypB [Anaerolineaceae bacterium]
MTDRIEIVRRIMDSNQRVAAANRALLDENGVYGINVMASPGAGKTSVIMETLRRLPSNVQTGVIEGDTAPVTIDADKIAALGFPAVQINTGGDCHLDAVMVEMALKKLALDELNLIIVENVGNLICPASFELGTHANIVIASIPEGDDKPYKYPNIYRGLDVLILNKTDLLPYIDFRMDYFKQGIEMLNPGLKIFLVSCKTGEGFDAWIDWLTATLPKKA